MQRNIELPEVQSNQGQASLISVPVSPSQDVKKNSPTNDSNNMQSCTHRYFFKKSIFLSQYNILQNPLNNGREMLLDDLYFALLNVQCSLILGIVQCTNYLGIYSYYTLN